MKRAALLAVLLAGGCRLIPGYEVLPMPADADRYRVGSGWEPGVGPVTPPADDPALFETARGVEKLATTLRPTQVLLQIKAPFAEWLSGALGLRSSEQVALELGDLRHAFVRDATLLPTNKAVLWETVTARNVTFTVAEGASVDVALLSKKLQEATGVKKLEVRAHGESKRSFSVRSDRPLVVAIRVVTLSHRIEEPPPLTLDLTQGAIGREQDATLGYRVVVRSVRPAERKATLRISNSAVPGGLDESHAFTEASWLAPHRSVIGAEDWILDRLQVRWATDLSQCALRVTRYHLRVEEAGSGLDTR